jgi:hypothetical protein
MLFLVQSAKVNGIRACEPVLICIFETENG